MRAHAASCGSSHHEPCTRRTLLTDTRSRDLADREPVSLQPLPNRSRVDWRLPAAALLLVGLALAFWLTSRYPALGEKARISGEIESAPQFGLTTVIDVPPGSSLQRRLVGNAVNWLWVNRQGMAFGIMFGALMLTALSLVKRTSFRSAVANSALGVIIGAPLGVCVNCAAPISHAMRRGGARSETALAAMFASPTYNVVVISIGLSLLPTYMVLLKLLLTLVFILTLVPRIARHVPEAVPPAPKARRAKWLFGDPLGENFTIGVPTDGPGGDQDGDGDWGLRRSIWWVVRTTARNLWEVARLALPLMLFAAVIGSVLVTAVPFDAVIRRLPTEGLLLPLAALLFIALVGLALPMPIAFDVMLPGALWAAGLPTRYVMVLFFTLGIYSVYSAGVVAVVFSRRAAWMLAVPLLVIGVVSGFASESYSDWRESRARQAVNDEIADYSPVSQVIVPVAQSGAQVLASLTPTQLAYEQVASVVSGDVADIAISRVPFSAAGPATGTFSQISGTTLGLDDRPRLHPAYNFGAPFGALGAVAAGDVHNDGWPDLLITSDAGITLYANRGGEFIAQEVAGGALVRDFGIIAGLVDLDGDGQLDILATFIDGTNLAVFNTDGEFLADSLRLLPSHPDPGAFLRAVTAADFDQDGRLDIVAGWWSQHQGTAANQLWHQTEGAEFEVRDLPGQPGQTLSVLAADLNADGWVDLMVGNDFAEPDVLYRNDGQGDLIQVTASDNLVPHSTRTTMSLTSADFDNDLDIDVFAAQVTSATAVSAVDDGNSWCDQYAESAVRERCMALDDTHVAIFAAARERSSESCDPLPEDFRVACNVRAITRARTFEAPATCDPMDETFPLLAELCWSHSVGGQRGTDDGGTQPPDYVAQVGDIPSVRGPNVLLVNGGSVFTDESQERGIEQAGWVWDTAFFDADHDGDLDLAVMNGSQLLPENGPNLFFRNDGGVFENITTEAGFADYSTTLGSAVADLDNDGDFDLVTIPNDGPPMVLFNSVASAPAIMLDLHPPDGAVLAGTRVEFELADGSRFVREITVGGGYLGFDQPRVHLGLGDSSGPVDVSIRWSDGRSSAVADLEPGYVYIVGPHG